jgi:hypothetical protein
MLEMAQNLSLLDSERHARRVKNSTQRLDNMIMTAFPRPQVEARHGLDKINIP